MAKYDMARLSIYGIFIQTCFSLAVGQLHQLFGGLGGLNGLGGLGGMGLAGLANLGATGNGGEGGGGGGGETGGIARMGLGGFGNLGSTGGGGGGGVGLGLAGLGGIGLSGLGNLGAMGGGAGAGVAGIGGGDTIAGLNPMYLDSLPEAMQESIVSNYIRRQQEQQRPGSFGRGRMNDVSNIDPRLLQYLPDNVRDRMQRDMLRSQRRKKALGGRSVGRSPRDRSDRTVGGPRTQHFGPNSMLAKIVKEIVHPEAAPTEGIIKVAMSHHGPPSNRAMMMEYMPHLVDLAFQYRVQPTGTFGKPPRHVMESFMIHRAKTWMEKNGLLSSGPNVPPSDAGIEPQSDSTGPRTSGPMFPPSALNQVQSEQVNLTYLLNQINRLVKKQAPEQIPSIESSTQTGNVKLENSIKSTTNPTTTNDPAQDVTTVPNKRSMTTGSNRIAKKNRNTENNVKIDSNKSSNRNVVSEPSGNTKSEVVSKIARKTLSKIKPRTNSETTTHSNSNFVSETSTPAGSNLNSNIEVVSETSRRAGSNLNSNLVGVSKTNRHAGLRLNPNMNVVPESKINIGSNLNSQINVVSEPSRNSGSNLNSNVDVVSEAKVSIGTGRISNINIHSEASGYAEPNTDSSIRNIHTMAKNTGSRGISEPGIFSETNTAVVPNGNSALNLESNIRSSYATNKQTGSQGFSNIGVFSDSTTHAVPSINVGSNDRTWTPDTFMSNGNSFIDGMLDTSGATFSGILFGTPDIYWTNENIESHIAGVNTHNTAPNDIINPSAHSEPSVYIDQSANIGSNIQSEPSVFIDQNANIGSNLLSEPNVYIDQNANIGSNKHSIPSAYVEQNANIAIKINSEPSSYIEQSANIGSNVHPESSVYVDQNANIGSNVHSEQTTNTGTETDRTFTIDKSHIFSSSHAINSRNSRPSKVAIATESAALTGADTATKISNQHIASDIAIEPVQAIPNQVIISPGSFFLGGTVPKLPVSKDNLHRNSVPETTATPQQSKYVTTQNPIFSIKETLGVYLSGPEHSSSHGALPLTERVDLPAISKINVSGTLTGRVSAFKERGSSSSLAVASNGRVKTSAAVNELKTRNNAPAQLDAPRFGGRLGYIDPATSATTQSPFGGGISTNSYLDNLLIMQMLSQNQNPEGKVVRLFK